MNYEENYIHLFILEQRYFIYVISWEEFTRKLESWKKIEENQWKVKNSFWDHVYCVISYDA